ncbi:MAG: serine/threonine protein phosphatase [Bdellovibrio sp.]|nr:MAG: serine/threonine protein phosphatase [Bdellovibrio sp.]
MVIRIIAAIAALLGILGSGFYYLDASLTSQWNEKVLLFVPFLAVFSFPMVMALRSRGLRPVFRIVAAEAAYFSMAILSFLFIFTLLRDVTAIYGGYHFTSQTVVLVSILAHLAGTAFAAAGPYQRKVELTYEDLPTELQGFKIAQISDLHLGFWIRAGYARRMVEKINSWNPDLVVLTGDIGDGSIDELRGPLAELRNLKAREGLFYVPGNHEFYWNVDEWIAALSGLGIRPLLNAGTLIQRGSSALWLAGISDPAADQVRHPLRPNLAAADLQAVESPTAFKILLSHRPGYAAEAAQRGFRLQLSGHTHGGQFFPWTLVVRLFHRYCLGLYRRGAMYIYVSAGTGSWGPLLRFGTIPEVTEIILKR